MLYTAQYLLERYGGANKARLRKRVAELCKLGVSGKFYAMRTGLSELISKLDPNTD
jgi:hypothetical protein